MASSTFDQSLGHILMDRVTNLLVSYSPTYTKSREQAFPLEANSEGGAISGGDSYYEDFTDGLQRFVQAMALKTGGATGAALILSLSGGDGKDPPDDSDDELDAQEDETEASGPSILSYAVPSDEAKDQLPGPTVLADAEAPTSVGADVNDGFHADVKSLLTFVREVGDDTPKLPVATANSASVRYNDEDSDGDDGDGDDGDGDDGNDGDGDDDDDGNGGVIGGTNSSEQHEVIGAMDETELEYPTYGTGESILASVAPTTDTSA